MLIQLIAAYSNKQTNKQTYNKHNTKIPTNQPTNKQDATAAHELYQSQ
jgi:hypothetical protein